METLVLPGELEQQAGLSGQGGHHHQLGIFDLGLQEVIYSVAKQRKDDGAAGARVGCEFRKASLFFTIADAVRMGTPPLPDCGIAERHNG